MPTISIAKNRAIIIETSQNDHFTANLFSDGNQKGRYTSRCYINPIYKVSTFYVKSFSSYARYILRCKMTFLTVFRIATKKGGIHLDVIIILYTKFQHSTANRFCVMRDTYVRTYVSTYVRTYIHTYVHTYIRTDVTKNESK